jgi:hypothetical protein
MFDSGRPLYHIISTVLSLAICHSCCLYEPIDIQILKSADHRITSEIQRIMMVNHALYNKSRFLNEENLPVRNNYDSIVTNHYFEGLSEALIKSPRFDLISMDPITMNKAGYNERFKSMDWVTVKELCRDSSIDALLVLENYQVLYSDKVPVYYSPAEGNFYGTLKMENNSLWKIYFPSKDTIVDDYLQKDTLYWDGHGDSEYEVYDQIPEAKQAVFQSCYYAGIKYGERISQTWVNKKRYLITCENKDFKKALEMAKQNNWMIAIDIWKKFPYGKNKRLASYASYNLAVASEIMDNIDAALEWASKSYFIKNRKDAFIENYIRILEDRKNEKEIILDQLE